MAEAEYVTTLVRTRSGMAMKVFEGDSIGLAIRRHGEYDGNTLDSLRDILAETRPELALDVGANIGNHALVIARYVNTLVAFEPVPFIHDVLVENVALNRLNNVHIVQGALSDTAAERKIHLPVGGNLGTASLEVEPGARDATYTIRTFIGDTYLRAHFAGKSLDFIKIDVEGHEPQALMGLRHTIRACQPLVLMEYRSPTTMKAFTEGAFFEDLFPGYQVWSLASTTSKKAHGRGLRGFLRRMRNKMQGEAWCFAGFDPQRRYSNIYLIPERYRYLTERFRTLLP